MKAAEVQAVREMVNSVSWLEEEYFSCATEDYLEL